MKSALVVLVGPLALGLCLLLGISGCDPCPSCPVQAATATPTSTPRPTTPPTSTATFTPTSTATSTADPDIDPNSDPDCDPDSYAVAHAHSVADSHSDPDAYADAAASRVVRSGWIVVGPRAGQERDFIRAQRVVGGDGGPDQSRYSGSANRGCRKQGNDHDTQRGQFLRVQLGDREDGLYRE